MTNMTRIQLRGSEFLAAKHNVHSQFGEDGIVKAILSKIPSRNSWCVEFGAWDGEHLSNSRNLIVNEHYSAVLIEAGKDKYAELVARYQPLTRVTCINAFVGFQKIDSLDTLLRQTDCPIDFDFLSIDIDGNDIHAWDAIAHYRPKLVCIEFNPTIPTAAVFSQPPDPLLKWGASLRSLFHVAGRKDYQLVCINQVNAFFVAKEYWSGDYAKTDGEISEFREHEIEPVFAFSGYDGTVLLTSDMTLNWHGIAIGSRDLQVLPRSLRRYPDDYNKFQRLALRVFNRSRRLLNGVRRNEK